MILIGNMLYLCDPIMTVLSKPLNGNTRSVPKCSYKAPIPLQHAEKKKIPKDDLLEFNLHSTPTDENSAKYKYKVAIFEEGMPEEVLELIQNVQHLITSLNMTAGPPMYAQM